MGHNSVDWWTYKKRRLGHRESPPDMCTLRGRAAWGHSEETAICRWRRGASGEAKPSTPRSWTSRVQNSEKSSLCWGHQHRDLVTAALANSYSGLALYLFCLEFPEILNSINWCFLLTVGYFAIWLFRYFSSPFSFACLFGTQLRVC